MTDKVDDTVGVHQLTSLMLVIDGKRCQFPVRKPKKQSVDDFMIKVRGEFIRRVSACTSRPYHSVIGYPALEDASIEDIFEEVYQIAYENEDPWRLQRDKMAGVIFLQAPRTPANTEHRTQSSKSTSQKAQRLAAKVLIRTPVYRWPSCLAGCC